jgi:hypothetical protein
MGNELAQSIGEDLRWRGWLRELYVEVVQQTPRRRQIAVASNPNRT